MSHPLKPIDVAVVGLGIAGTGIHLKALRQDPRFRVTGVADPDPERQERVSAEWKCPAFSSVDELLEGCDAELVIIATPTHFHERDARAVLDHGRHCLLEKPMALGYQAAASLHQHACNRQRLLAINHSHLYRSDFYFLREVIRSGLLGELFEISFNWSSYKRRNDWQTLRANGGGHLGNHGTHALSILLPLVGGRVTSLSASVRHLKDAGDAEDHAHLFLKTDNGIAANLIVSTCLAIPGPRYALYGSHGAAVSDGSGTVRLRYYDAKAAPPLALVSGPRQPAPPESLPWAEEVREIKAEVPYRNVHDNLFSSIREQAPLLSSSGEALEVMRMIDWAVTGRDPAGADTTQKD